MASLSPPRRQNYGSERRGRKSDGGSGAGEVKRRQLTKVLFNVSMQNSLWPVQVMISPENTAGELMKAAIDIYGKEKRLPVLGSTDPAFYELHYSQFNFESLNPEEKLEKLGGSRNFYVCAKSGSARQT
ncbi:hypothetical protein C2S52_005435 [Perilla frutescens var. hirtella]|nr:hypothetical protein C2S52_005435 [Perilla frutescens var. hirtella]